jgi:Arc/MetJ-type ribon-helix-helix transcriptional regulator
MGDATAVITFKLTPTEVRALNEVTSAGFYPSRSSAVRHALGLLFERHKVSPETDQQIEKERREHRPRSRLKRPMTEFTTMPPEPVTPIKPKKTQKKVIPLAKKKGKKHEQKR